MVLAFVFIASIVLQFQMSIVDSRSARIVGGRPVYIDQVPYMINVRTNGSFHCGGSLITPKCVLTAAHCVRNSEPHHLEIQGGITFLNEPFNRRAVKNIFIPATFNITNLDNDVAIFELYTPLKGDFIQTIELSNESPRVGDFVKVSGWGLTKENGIVSQQLKSVYVAVESQEKCRRFYKAGRYVTDNMFCAYIPGLKDACLGDSGGPAVFDGQLVGIVSWGKRSECARRNSPGVYVNVPAIRPWIEHIMANHCY